MSILSGFKKAAGLAGTFVAGGASWQVYAWAALAGAAALGGAVWWHADQVDNHFEASFKAGQEQVRGQQVAAENAALRESMREISRLVTVNQEVQGAYNEVLGQLADADARRAAGAGLRNAERAAIVAAASRAAAGTCDRYAAISERHLEGVERDAEQMGRLAVRATAGVEALQRTLRERNAVRSRPARTDQPQPETQP